MNKYICLILIAIFSIACNNSNRNYKQEIEDKQEKVKKFSKAEIKELTDKGFKIIDYIDPKTRDTILMQEYFMAFLKKGKNRTQSKHDIHKRLGKALGARPLAMVENHHNFAWKEIVNGEELVVHRKGATPAQKGVLGIIPGSMTAPGFIVRGTGNVHSLQSASHEKTVQSKIKTKIRIIEW